VKKSPPAKFPRRVELVAPMLPEARELLPDLEAALKSKRLSNNGKFVRRLERRMREVLAAPHVVATASCTLGLVVAMRALGWRGEVIAPSFSFAATAHAIVWAGCTPVLADIDPKTFLLDPASVERLCGPQTAGVLAMDVFGLPSDVEELEAAAGMVPVLFDAAHSLGSVRPGRRAPRAAVYSLHATKTFVAGEGGLFATTDAELAQRFRRLINFGFVSDGYDCDEVGINAKLPELSAILAYHQVDFLKRILQGREQWNATYRAVLADVPGLRFQELPADRSSNYQYTALVVDERAFGRSRDALVAALLAHNVVAKPYFSPPIHQMSCYAGKLRCDDLRHTEALAAATLCLPIHPEEPLSTAERIAELVRSLAHSRATAQHRV